MRTLTCEKAEKKQVTGARWLCDCVFCFVH